MPSDPTLRADEIEALLQQAQEAQEASASKEPAPTSAAAPSPAAHSQPVAAQQAAEAPAVAVQERTASEAPPKLSQEEIESLFNKPATAAAPARPAASATAASEASIQSDDIELLLQKAEAAIRSIDDPVGETPSGVRSFKLEDFNGAPPSQEAATIRLLGDVELDLKIELGRTHMYLEEVLKLRKGSVVPLDKLAGDPVDVYVNGRLIARGEVLVLNDNFCVRVAELVSAESAAG